jgi:uncharacterized protein (DUF1015 family)
MPEIRPIPAVTFAPNANGKTTDLSRYIAPPYDVLDQAGKDRLLQQAPHNIVAIDLPHLPPKTVGPDSAYETAGRDYRQWLVAGLLTRRRKPAMFVYQQSFQHPGNPGQQLKRRGLITNLAIQPFGPNPSGHGGVHPHEQTFSAPKEDRMKLMRAVQAQLSPIFGMFNDPARTTGELLDQIIRRSDADFTGVTANDSVLHEIWAVDKPADIEVFTRALDGLDTFIADGHHRYTTALNYQRDLAREQGGKLPPDHPANYCLFVLIGMQDPGLIVLPTHRVLGGLAGFTWDKFLTACQGKVRLTPCRVTDLASLESALISAGPHAIGVYCPANPDGPYAIATTTLDDPLADRYPQHAPAWRQLDVAMVQHLIVEQMLQPAFCKRGEAVQWKFPHTLAEVKSETESVGFNLGLVLKPPTLDSIRKVSEAGLLMPQKSTFFYPKLATGLVINPLN